MKLNIYLEKNKSFELQMLVGMHLENAHYYNKSQVLKSQELEKSKQIYQSL